MSRHGEIRLPFGPEERTFRLGIGELRKIEERCDAGAPELLTRLSPLVRAIEAKLTFAQILQAGRLGSWRSDAVRSGPPKRRWSGRRLWHCRATSASNGPESPIRS